MGIVSLSSVVLSPLSGLALDKLGGSEITAFVFMTTSIAVFGLLGFVEMASPVPVIALGGVCYGVLPSALYPLLAECVPEEAFPQVSGREGEGRAALCVPAHALQAGRGWSTCVAACSAGHPSAPLSRRRCSCRCSCAPARHLLV